MNDDARLSMIRADYGDSFADFSDGTAIALPKFLEIAHLGDKRVTNNCRVYNAICWRLTNHNRHGLEVAVCQGQRLPDFLSVLLYLEDER